MPTLERDSLGTMNQIAKQGKRVLNDKVRSLLVFGIVDSGSGAGTGGSSCVAAPCLTDSPQAGMLKLRK